MTPPTCRAIRAAARTEFCPADCELRGKPPASCRCVRLQAVADRVRAQRETADAPMRPTSGQGRVRYIQEPEWAFGRQGRRR